MLFSYTRTKKFLKKELGYPKTTQVELPRNWGAGVLGISKHKQQVEERGIITLVKEGGRVGGGKGGCQKI